MEDSLWDKVLPAASALAGFLLNSWIDRSKTKSHREYERRTLLLEKLEKLNEALSDAIAWTDEVLRAKSFDELRRLYKPLAARRAFALTMVYFPDLVAPADRLSVASMQLMQFLCSVSAKECLDPVAVVAHRADPERFAELGREIADAGSGLDNAIRVFAEAQLKV